VSEIDRALASALNIAVNTALKYDPGTRYALEKLSPCTLQLQLNTPACILHCDIRGQTLTFVGGLHDDADVTLEGSCADALMFLFAKGKHLADTGLKVSGKVGLLLQLSEIFQALEIDWRDLLVDVFGNSVGTQAGIFTQFVLDNLRELKRDLEERAEPVLTDELKILAHRDEVRIFVDEVDELRSRSERLLRRFENFTQRRKG